MLVEHTDPPATYSSRYCAGSGTFIGSAQKLAIPGFLVLLCSLLVPASVRAQDTTTSIVADTTTVAAAVRQFEFDTIPPVAQFNFHPIDGAFSRQIAFDASPSLDNTAIVAYEWRFGDGTSLSSSRAVSVVHTYPNGEFKVSLTVVDTAGLRSTHTDIIRADASPVVAQAGVPAAKSDVTAPAATETTLPDPLVDTITLLQPPTGIAPEQGEVVLSGANTSFVWQPRSGAGLYDFRILDSASDVMVRIGEFAASSICSRNRCKLTQDLELDVGRGYSWQVRARNEAGWSGWSDTGFNVFPPGLKKPRMPLSLFPGADTTINNDDTITFLWEHQAAVESYRFQVIDRTTGKVLVDTRALSRMFCNPTQCAYSRPVNLSTGDIYAWQIQALNPAGESGWFRTAFEVVRSDKQALPVAEFSYSLASTDPMSVAFNASRSSGQSALSRYEWLFGDGQRKVVASSDQQVSHQFARGGSFLVELKVTDASGLSDTVQRLINVGEGTVPEARFRVDGFVHDATGTAPLIATFDPTESSDDSAIVDYAWDFGDGGEVVNNGDAAVVSYSYTQAGEFTVSLTVTDDSGLKAIYTRRVTVQDSAEALSVVEAGRFIAHATFGANDSEITRLMETGYEAWLRQQFQLKGAPHIDYVEQFPSGNSPVARHEIWWQDVVRGEDQLRQRVAFGLSQIFDVPESLPGVSGMQKGLTVFYDLLRDHAFGNYRDLLEAVVLNPAMGFHTGMLGNTKDGGITDTLSSYESSNNKPSGVTRVDQGLARVLLQRFTLGEFVLESDGTPTRVPAYSVGDVENIARALTGWNLRDVESTASKTASWEYPMVAYESHHDRETKTLPGGEVTPPELTAQDDLTLVLDNLFAHPNVGPFLVRQLIQKLVTSNPSAGYIKRIAAIFNDNGVGTRGDLESVIKAILMDSEARGAPRTAQFGKLREPELRLAHLWRAFGVEPGTASVHGELNLEEFTLDKLHEVTDDALATAALIDRQIQRHYSGTPHSDDLQSAYLDFSAEYAIADQPKALLGRLDRVLMAGTMSDDLFEVLHEHLTAIPDTAVGRVTRVHDAVSLIVASPDYLVQM